MTQKKESNSCKSCNSSIHNFFTGLGGLGTLLLGVAACIALSKTDTVLEKIFNIQEMAGNIDKAVDELKTGNTQIHKATHEINDLVKKIKQDTSDIIEDSLRKNGMPEELKRNSHNKEEISNILNRIPNEHGNHNKGDLYLPTEKFSVLKQKLQEKAPKASLEEITDILKENLKIWKK